MIVIVGIDIIDNSSCDDFSCAGQICFLQDSCCEHMNNLGSAKNEFVFFTRSVFHRDNERMEEMTYQVNAYQKTSWTLY